jgi:hypothetical protein
MGHIDNLNLIEAMDAPELAKTEEDSEEEKK